MNSLSTVVTPPAIAGIHIQEVAVWTSAELLTKCCYLLHTYRLDQMLLTPADASTSRFCCCQVLLNITMTGVPDHLK